MDTDIPRRTREYRNHHLDSRRWDLYQPRDGDVVVSTAYKAGTTWTQLIVLTLLEPDSPEIANVSGASARATSRLRRCWRRGIRTTPCA